MDAACLRVRFSPLLQNINKDSSKCCLEIAPELLCLRNLDKLQWNHGDNSIEYTIPITYKVTLKKKAVENTDKEYDENAIQKIYHSCVDLLIPSSLSKINLGSGDVTRVTSDTIILSKLSMDINKNKGMLENTRLTKNSEDYITQSLKDKIEEESMQETANINQIVVENKSQKDMKIYRPRAIQIVNNMTYHDKLIPNNKTTNTDSEYLMCNHFFSTNIRSFANTVDPATSSLKYKGKLSISPICSLDTDYRVSDEVQNVLSNFIICKVQEPEDNVTSIEEIDNHGIMQNIPSIKDYGYKPKVRIVTYNRTLRILPQLRIAHFVQKMEQEILPLKIMLNEMICKCVSLGFAVKEAGRQNATLCKNVVNYKKQSKQSCKKDFKCNRVVYTVVFDG